MRFAWQVEVIHTDSAGINDVSAWHSHATRGRERRKEWEHANQCEAVAWREPPHVLFTDVTVFIISTAAGRTDVNQPTCILPSSSHVETCHDTHARHTVLNNKAKDMCPLGGGIAHYLWATFHLHSWLLWEPLWLWWKSHKPLLGDSTGLTADTLMESFVIGSEGNDSVS